MSTNKEIILVLLLLTLSGCISENTISPEKEFFKPPGKLYMIASYYQDDIKNNIASDVIFHYYDNGGRIAREAYAVPNRKPHKYKDYEYAGETVYIRTKETENEGESDCKKQQFVNGKLFRVSDCAGDPGSYTEFIYDNSGHLIEEIMYDTRNGELYIVKSTTYDYLNGKLHHKYSPPYSYEYIYDNDMLKEVIDMEGNVAVEKFFYNNDKQLIKKEEWYYDHGFQSYYLNYTRLYYYYE